METKPYQQPIKYYAADSMLRYNPLWALVCGERSVGKSFEFKKRSINTPDSIWVYLRRTDKLRRDPKNWKSYLSDLLQKEKIDIDADYKVNSEGIWVDGIQKVIFSSLSTDSGAHSMNYLPDTMDKMKKKRSKYRHEDFDDEGEDADEYMLKVKAHANEVSGTVQEAICKVKSEYDKPVDIKKKIVFEEMLEPTGNYLRNEVELLFEHYITIDRYTGTQLFGLANLMTSYNIYFDYFGITPFTQEFKWFKNKTLLVQNVKIPGMDEFVKSQRFYNLVDGTKYGDYLTSNTPWKDDNFGVAKRPPKALLRFNLRLHGELFGVWEHDGLIYISKKHNPNTLTFSGLKSLTDDDIPIKKGEGAHKLLNTATNEGILRFESIPLRDITYEVINGKFKEL